jgi:hypothetical protein
MRRRDYFFAGAGGSKALEGMKDARRRKGALQANFRAPMSKK